MTNVVQPVGSDPGIWEDFSCWVNAGGVACRDARESRYFNDEQEMRRQAQLYGTSLELMEVEAGYNDAIRQETSSQFASTALLFAPFLLIAGGSVAAYFWWRNKQYRELDEELYRGDY
jgi:hypothetical protein